LNGSPHSAFQSDTHRKRAYPVEDKPHARNAKARASQAVKAGRMSKGEAARIDRKADTVLKGD